ncbi:hypothetical protein L6452_15764 [Arctium lappa]|uniref:Uncharacterized protein n=1 Tax=Arctium lappa TaxID=4217 RepID=A0ACB9CPS6_ARCLA|nr:hypothetical protein L6452_15764 [Arctium lappa]
MLIARFLFLLSIFITLWFVRFGDLLFIDSIFPSISVQLRALLDEKFFNSCLSHRILQIRRYMYNDVLPLRDAQKIFYCSLIQVSNKRACRWINVT